MVALPAGDAKLSSSHQSSSFTFWMPELWNQLASRSGTYLCARYVTPGACWRYSGGQQKERAVPHQDMVSPNLL